MSNFETVEGSIEVLDPLCQKQKEDVARMRTSLLACADNPESVQQTLSKITALRIYHQMTRIIRYIEMMDKIENKMYESIEACLDTMNVRSSGTWIMLANLQEKLQKSMIESHKLIEPYIELTKKADIVFTEPESAPSGDLLTLDSRERIRSAAQALLRELNISDDDGTK